jgi:serine/arginine repetitive matrix protein 2
MPSSIADVSLFNLKRPQTAASASAHKAATQAFLSSRASQANLSASAAAQALRTMTPPPVPVDQVQTRRMIERQASSGSLSNSARGRGRGGLQRQNSAGSMTERTFRTPSPSPSRPVSHAGPPAPPMPSIPQQYASPTAPAGTKKKKRASSQEAPPPRVLSPPLTRPEHRGQSLDRFGSHQPPPLVTPGTNHVPQSNELEKVDSRNSINFSRPLSPRPQSPLAQSPVSRSPVLANGDRPNTSAKMSPVAAAIAPAAAAKIQHDLLQTANQPVKKKKKKAAPGAYEGNHLQAGTMANKPIVSPAAPRPEPEVQQAVREAQPTKKKKARAVVTGEDTHFPPAESPRTESDSDSNVGRKREKRVQRASGILQKQPSIVREDWEGEQQEEVTPPQARPAVDSAPEDAPTPLQSKQPRGAVAATGSSSQGALATPVAATQPVLSPPKPEEPLSPAEHLQVSESQTTRGSSLSPSRSTRFSDRLSSDLAAGIRHEPPPRSISPAKPALKHSSPGPRLDGQTRGSSVTPSESSDVSTASIDGLPKRKKSARVSFDAQPEIVGVAVADANSVGSPGKERKSWLGLGKSRPQLNSIPSDGSMEELMKPRPQLPSFGSVRGQKFRDAAETNSAQTARSQPETAQESTDIRVSSASVSSSETSSSYAPYSTGISSDHAVGAILAQEARRANENPTLTRSNEPLPPEVRSVEGILSYSDEESDLSEGEQPTTVPLTQAYHEPLVGFVGNAATSLTAVQQPPTSVNFTQQVEPLHPVELDVPILAVSPPTPADESKGSDQYLVEVPGGFPVSAESLAKLDESSKSLPGRGKSAREDDVDDSDNDSIYSDAAEDPSEMEGMGFGSIDAILESPIPAPTARPTASPESPQAAAPAPPFPPVRTASWEETQARWSGIAQQTRQAPGHLLSSESQLPASQGQSSQRLPATDSPPEQVPQPSQPGLAPSDEPPRRRKKKKSPAAIAAAASVPPMATAVRTPPESPLLKKNQASSYPNVDAPNLGRAAAAAAPFRQSLRASSPPETEPGFRKTMRQENRKSMPAPAVTGSLRAQQPVAVSPPTQPRAALQKKHIPLATAAAATAPLPRAKPAPLPAANDSDSESSFKKSRRSKSTSGGKYTMRRSMRGASDSTWADPRNGVRSVSPVGRRPFSPPEHVYSMRSTMRSSMDNTPTLRGTNGTKRSSSMFGRNNSTTALPAGFGRTNRSRILDSDDEDEQPRPSKFRSRFADDSDDDIDVPQFAPVRGIPRRGNDGDSTDLDDSSDEERPPAASKAPPKLQIPQNATPVAPSSAEPLSPNSEKKRGLFGRFRSKKPKDETLSPVSESPQAPAKTTIDTSKPSRLGFASNAERDRMIELTRAKLEAAKEQTHPTGPQQGHGKLQRRQMPERVMSDSWPLPPPIPPAEKSSRARPSTSDGPIRNGSTRLNQGSMRRPDVASDAVGRSGKKKKFPMLRKVFGLTD